MQVGGGSLMVLDVLMWHGLSLLVQLNILLTGSHYILLFHNYSYLFIDFMYLNIDRLLYLCHQALVAKNWFVEHSRDF